MKRARRQDLRQWLRSKPKPSMVEGIGLLCAILAVLVPGLACLTGVTGKSQPLTQETWLLCGVAAAVLLVLGWSSWRRTHK